MTEVFDEFTVMDDPVKEENCVVYLLASLLEYYNVLVTALEASPEVSAFAVVTERLLHEETKMKNRSADSDQEGALRNEEDVTSVIDLATSKGSVKHMRRSKDRSRREPKLEPSK